MKLINTVNNKEIDFDGENILLSERESSGIDADHSLSSGNYNGAMYMGGRLRERNMSLIGCLNISPSRFQVEKRKLCSIINPLHLVRVINESYTIEGYPVSTVKFAYNDEENTTGLYKFVIDIVCPDPYWKDITKNKSEIALWKGMFHFPLIMPKQEGIIMGLKQPSLIVNIENKGDVETGMIIEFKARGTLSNPSLFNVNTRESIKVNKNMVAGEVIKVNTNYGEKRIENVLNGVTTNILNLIDLGGGDTFLQLDAGDNLLRYDADTNPSNLEINIYFSPRYLGV